MSVTNPQIAGIGAENMAGGAAGMVPGAQPNPQQGGADLPPEVKQKIVQALTQLAQRKQMAATPRPSSVPAQQSTEPPGYMQKGRAWGPERMMSTLQKSLQNATAKTKEGQILKAQGVFDQINAASNELYAAQSSGDKKAEASAQSKLDAIMSDPKTMKGVAEALNQDWLNPEKTTTWKIGMQRSMADAQKKNQAQQGIMGVFNKMKQKVQGAAQPQFTPEQQQSMAREMQAKAPTTMSGGSIKDQTEAAKGVLDIEKASAEAREKYQFITSNDGKVWAVNKNDPKDSFQIKDRTTGTEITGKTTGTANDGLKTQSGIPIYVKRGGKLLTPESPEWTKDDQRVWDSGMKAAKIKQQLKIDPIIADEIGEAPDPENFKGGKSSPEYGAALKKFGMEAEQAKTRMAGSAAAARGKAYGEYRPVQIINPDTHNVEYVFAKDAIAQGAAGASEGGKVMSKQAQIGDIETASKKVRESIKNLDRPFDAEQIAKLDVALKSPDESIAQAEFKALAQQNLTPAQQDFVVWISQINERAMSLRNIAGMGQGAQDTRNAIRAMLPGVGSGSTEMALKQLDAFDQQVKVLKSGIPSVKGTTPSSTPKVLKYDKDGNPVGN
jgi:hypothetical protein